MRREQTCLRTVCSRRQKRRLWIYRRTRTYADPNPWTGSQQIARTDRRTWKFYRVSIDSSRSLCELSQSITRPISAWSPDSRWCKGIVRGGWSSNRLLIRSHTEYTGFGRLCPTRRNMDFSWIFLDSSTPSMELHHLMALCIRQCSRTVSIWWPRNFAKATI